MTMADLLCLVCGETSHVDGAVPGCPACGDQQHIPADLADTVTVMLTRHELRILTMWASAWAHQHGTARTVQVILDRLNTQTDTPLTLSQEIADLRASLPGSRVIVHDADGNPIDM